MAPHGGAHLGSTCVAAVDNGLITESYTRLNSYLHEFVEPIDFRDGHIYMTARPGLGLVWHEAAIQKRVAQSGEATGTRSPGHWLG